MDILIRHTLNSVLRNPVQSLIVVASTAMITACILVCLSQTPSKMGPPLSPVPFCPNTFLIGRVGGDTLVTDSLTEQFAE